MTPFELALLLLLGAWAALDGTAAGQFMISRPLVSGTLSGWILGDPGTGLLVGGLLEAIHLGGVPVGGTRLPEPGPGAVPAVAAAALVGGAGGMAVGTVLGLVWSHAGGWTMVIQRRVNGRLVRGAEEGRIPPRSLALRHWSCVGLDGLRGIGLAGTGIALVLAAPASLAERWPLELPVTVALLLLPAAPTAGALLRSWTPPRRRIGLLLFAAVAGVASGVLF